MYHTRDQAEMVRSQLEQWLAPRGPSFNEDKTRIVHLDDGFDFLGFNVRRYGGQVADQAKQRGRGAVSATTHRRGALPSGLQRHDGDHHAQPHHPGWAAYYRGVVSKEVFSMVDDHLWRLTYRWALRSHPNKSKRWVVSRYFGQFNRFRQNRWIFGDRDSGAYLRRFDWTKIVRHRMVMGTSSPDDPVLTEYWADRRATGPHR